LSGSDLAYVALALTPGIGHARMAALLGRFGSAAAAMAASQRELEHVPGISPAAATAVRSASIPRACTVVARAAQVGGRVLLPTDPEFPPALAEIPEPPTLLFAAGDLARLAAPAVAVVGSRTHTRYGAEVCRHLSAGAARAGLVVVSGMARGIDALAHAAALDAGGTTVGILGNGLGIVYPSANRVLYDRVRAFGVQLTEFPPGERPTVGSFQRRNRLISGLAKVTVIVEAREKSGALITADCALAQGRDVLAVPGPITSPTSVGCNRLIQSGAKPVLGLRDLLEEYGLGVETAAPARLPPDLSADERRALAELAGGEQHVDVLAGQLGLAAGETLAVLTNLELRGLVLRKPGPSFRKTDGEMVSE
jgi:DNA processing protein